MQDRTLVKNFSPSLITGGTTDIFVSFYRDIDTFLFYRSLAMFLRLSPSASAEFPLIKYNEPSHLGKLLLGQLFTAADRDRPEVNPFNLAALDCEAFFDHHPSVVEYFASVGCANWFGGSISSFHSTVCGDRAVPRSRRVAATDARELHCAHISVPETFITSASATLEDTLDRLLKTFVNSILALSAEQITI
jgi:hypothetical protein